MTFNIAFTADWHLDYEAHGLTDSRGLNLRALDGEAAVDEIMGQILNGPDEIHAFCHGGDIYHRSHPSIRSIYLVNHYLRELNKRGITVYGLAGNHDTSDNRTHMSAVAASHDPDRNIHMLWKPYEKFQIADGIFLHSIAHHGLSGNDAPSVEAVPDALNLLMTHGAALDPKNSTLMKCIDSPREQILPPELILDDNFTGRMLGHYHSRYSVGGDTLETRYAGSVLRRGFSDEPGERGWFLVKIHEDGKIEWLPRNIRQRPQYDLDVIDAKHMNSTELQDAIEANLYGIGMDIDSDVFDEVDAPIVRQKVVNAERSIKAGVDRRRLSKLTRNMLEWKLLFKPIERIEELTAEGEDESQKKNSDLVLQGLAPGTGAGAVESFDEWASNSQTLAPFDDEKKKVIKEKARGHLEAVRAE